MFKLKHYEIGLIVGLILLGLTACEALLETPPVEGPVTETPATGTPMIGAQWPTGEPEDYGLDPDVLEASAQRMQRSSNGTRYGMVVIRKGVLVYEKYWNGHTPQDKYEIFSSTKSWGSTLIGIAVTQGLLSVTDEVTKWVPNPVNQISRGATVEHLLTQSAHSNPPGRSFRYNSGYLINTLPEILEAASGMTPHDFYEENLVKPLNLGMNWPACPAGGCRGTRYKEGFIQFGNQPPEAPNAELPTSTIRDLAKLGWLWANNGVWNGKRLIDPEYITAATSPSRGRADYGYLWWLDGNGQFSAVGGPGNSYCNVMPSRQLVIAVMGEGFQLGRGGSWADFQDIVNSIRD